MPQWIGSNEFFAENPDKRTNPQNMNRNSDIHNRLGNAESALRKEVNDARQLRRNTPPKPAAQRQPGFPARVITQQEAEVMRPPRQYSIPGARRTDRPVWPENTARGKSEKIPVHEGMLDGQSASATNRTGDMASPETNLRSANAAREAYQRDLRESEERGMRIGSAQQTQAGESQNNAPAYRQDSRRTPETEASARANTPSTPNRSVISTTDVSPAELSAIAATGMAESNIENGSVLSVSGLSPNTMKPVCDVGREMRGVSSSLEKSAIEQRILMLRLQEMEMRIHKLESRIEQLVKEESANVSLYDEDEMEELMELSEQQPESSSYDDEEEQESTVDMMMDDDLLDD